MFLVAKKFIFDIDERDKLKLLFKQEYSYLDLEPQEITFKIMTWRKANAIHKWFVDNVQDGEDDCKDYYVGIEELENLLKIIKEVLNDRENGDKARELLPTQQSFFYGGTEYDEYYWEDLVKTRDKLENLLNNEEYKNLDFYYSSSW